VIYALVLILRERMSSEPAQRAADESYDDGAAIT
jgi:hypothetical protein